MESLTNKTKLNTLQWILTYSKYQIMLKVF